MKKLLLMALIPLMMLIGAPWGNQIKAQMTTVEIGNGFSANYYLPFNNFYKYSFSQMVYTKSELGGECYIGAISFDKSGTSAGVFQEITIWMADLDDSVMTTTSWAPQSAMRQVYHANNFQVPGVAGDLTIALDSSFHHDANKNLAIIVSHKDTKYFSNIKFYYTQTESNYCIYRKHDTDETYANYPGTLAGSKDNKRPNIKLITNSTNSFCLPISAINVDATSESEITISWEAGTGGNNFDVAIIDTVSTGSSDLNQATIISMSGESYTFSNLTANTEYLVGVRRVSADGLMSDWTTTMVSTTETPNPTPFTCDFETEETRSLWTLVNGNLTNHWVMDTAAHFGEGSQYGMYISNDTIGTYAYNNNSQVSVFAKTLLNFNESGDYNIQYDWKCMGESTYDFLRVAVVPAYLNDLIIARTSMPTGISATALPNEVIAADGGRKLNLSSTWQHYLGVVNIPTAGNYYLVYLWRNDGTGGNNPPIAVDNINISQATCAGVDSVVVSDITNTSATINGYSASGSTFKLYLKEWTATDYDTFEITTPYTIDNLLPSTYYKGILQSVCDGDNISLSTTEFQFGTECSEITLPWSFDAECTYMKHDSGNERYPYCWDAINGKDNTYCWKYDDGNRAHTGNYGILFNGSYSSSNKHDDWLFTQSIPFTGNEEMSFWVKTTTSSSNSNYHGRFAIYASTSEATSITDTAHYELINITGDAVVSDRVDFVGDTWQHLTIAFPSTLVGDHNIAFVVKGTNAYSFCLDDIFLYTASSCETPTNVLVNTVSSTTARISWHSEATSFTVSYFEEGSDLGTVSSITTTDTTIELTELLPNTTYEFNITATCNDGVASNPTYPNTFTTTCAPLSADLMPFVENFADNETGSSSPLDPCMYKGTNYTTTAFPYVQPTQGNGNPNSLYFKSDENSYSYMALPSFEEEITNLVLSCSVYRNTNPNNTSDLSIGLMGNPYDINTFTPFDTLSPEALGEWSDFQISLSNYDVTAGQHIAFVLPANGTRDGVAQLDNIRVDVRTACNAPQNPKIDNILDSEVSVSWTDTENTSWVVYYGEPGFNADTVSNQITTNTTNTTITNLNPQTDYEFFVAAACDAETQSIPSIRKHFTTVCAPITELPYTEDFETYESGSNEPINSCWTKHVIGGTTEFPYPSSAAAINGSRGLNFKSYESNITHYSCYAALPLFEEEITSLKIKFNMENKIGSSAYSYNYASKLAVGVMSNPNDINTFDTVQIIDMSDLPTGTVELYEVTFNNYEGDGKYIALRATDIERGTKNYADNNFYIDDIEVAILPNCQRPTDFMINNVTATTIDLSWTGNTNAYEVKYSTNENMTDSTIVTANTNAIQLTGLNPYTYYYIDIRGICDGNVTSDWLITPERVRTTMDCGEGYQNFIDTIGGNTTTASSSYVLNGNSYNISAKNWIIYTDEELAEMGLLGTNNIIKSISLHTKTAGGAIPFRMYMAETQAEAFNDFLDDTITPSQMTLVYDGSIQFQAQNWDEIMLQTPFTYSDSANLMIAFVRDTNVSSSTEFYYHHTDVDRTAYIYTNSYNTYDYSQAYRGDMIFNICGDVPSCIKPLNITKTSFTSTSTSLAWEGSAANYQVVYGTEPFNPENITAEQVSTTVNTNNITLSGLTPNTNYYVSIRSICGNENSLWAIPFQFITPCDAISVPYIENFDSYPATTSSLNGQTIDPCWVKGTNYSSTEYPYITTSDAASAPNSMNFYRNNSSYSYASLPMFDQALSGLTMTFKLHITTANNGPMHIGVMSDQYDISTFQNIAYAQPSEVDVWQSFEVKFNNYTGNGKFITFMMPDSSTAKMQLDDIEVFETPSCESPINVTVDSITTNSALVSWTDRETAPAGGYELEYGPQGFEIGTGTRITSNVNPTRINNLTVGSEYDIYVRAICANNDDSRWSFKTSFLTNCGPIALPVTYDFENVIPGEETSLPHCFNRYNDATSSYYQKYPYVSDYTQHAHNGSQYVYWSLSSYSSNPNDAALIFPQIDTINYPMNGNQITFWGKSGIIAANLIVGIMTDPINISSFVAIDTITLNNTYAEHTVPFTNYTGTGIYPVIKMSRPTTTTSAYIDDITIEEIPACPRVYDLRAITATENTATISWTDTIGSTQWIVDYRTEDATTNQSVMVTTNPYTLTGLSTSTKYFFNVRPICTSGDTSAAVAQDASFWTTQVPATIPYSYDFEDATEWANWQTNSNCDINWYRGTVIAGQGAYSMYVSTDNGVTYSSDWDETVNAVAYRDIDFGPDTASFTMTFKANVGGTLEHNYDGVSVMLVDPTAEVISSQSTITTPWGHVNDVALTSVRRDTLWGTHLVHFEHIAGVHRVAFYWFNQSTGDNNPYINQPGAIDSITIVEQTCMRPYNLQASNIEATAATLNWSGDATDYEISYRVSGADPSTDINQVVSGNSVNISNLTASTDYIFWVRAICTANDTSFWSEPTSFSTICSRYLASDTIREDFSGITPATYNSKTGIMPNCWESYSGSTNNVKPHVIGSGSYWYAHNTNSLIMTSGNTYGTAIVRLPYTVEPVHTLTMSYWLCTESDTKGILEVGYLTGTDLATDFVAIKSIPASTRTKHSGDTGDQPAGTGIYDTVSFDSVPTTAQAIAFRWNVNGTFYSACLDDFEITANITCPAPICGTTTADYESAIITWDGTASNYQLLYKETTATDWSDTINTSTNSYTITNLLPETDYTVQIRALCGAENGNSVWSETSFTTEDLPCFIPTDLTASNVDYENVTLDWNSEGVATRWVVNIFNTTDNFIDTVESKPTTIEGLYAGIEYHASVKSICSNIITSDWSDTITFTTITCPGITNLAASNITTTSAVITWESQDAIKWEINYGYQIAQGEGEFRDVNERTYTITGLEPETDYDVYVRLYCTENTYGQWSDRLTFTTKEEAQGINGADENFKLSIYPNPTNGSTTISLNGIEGVVTINIVDINGRIITSETMECGSDCEKRMNVEKLAQGTYFVRILGDNINSVRKLIIR